MSYLGTRSVVQMIESGSEDVCPAGRGGCGRPVRFSAQVPSKLRKQVTANVYWQNKWNRKEVWHLHCYVKAGYVFGIPTRYKPEDKEFFESAVKDSPDLFGPELLASVVARYRSGNDTTSES